MQKKNILEILNFVHHLKARIWEQSFDEISKKNWCAVYIGRNILWKVHQIVKKSHRISDNNNTKHIHRLKKISST